MDERTQRALADPGGVYNAPDDVLRDSTLSDDEKRRVLDQWEADARELEVAEEEGMAGEPSESSMLRRVLMAQEKLPQRHDHTENAPTKQGGATASERQP